MAEKNDQTALPAVQPQDVEDIVTAEFEGASQFTVRNQVRALFRKSWTLQKRNKKTNCCQICFPIFIVALLVSLQAIIDALITFDDDGEELPEKKAPFFVLPQHPKAGQDSILFALFREAAIKQTNKLDFHVNLPMAYAHDEAVVPSSLVGSYGVDGILGGFSSGPFETRTSSVIEDDPRFVTINDFRVIVDGIDIDKKFSSKDDMDDFFYDAWKSVEQEYVGGWVFDQYDHVGKKYEMSVVFNETNGKGNDIPLLVNMFSSSLYGDLSASGSDNFTLMAVQDIPAEPREVSFDITVEAGPFFYIYLLQALFPVFVSTLVYEKEKKLREIMLMMGLKMEVYWMVNYFFFFILYLIVFMFLIFSGLASGSAYFRSNDFMVYFVLLFFWGHAMVCFAFFTSTLFSRTRTASITCYFFVIGVGMVSEFLIRTWLEDESGNTALINIFSLVPPVALYRGLHYLRVFTSSGEPGLALSDLPDDDVYMDDVYAYLFFVGWAYLLLAIYMEEVLKSSVGVKKEWNFFLKKEYWMNKKERINQAKLEEDRIGQLAITMPSREDGTVGDIVIENGRPDEPEDVVAERMRVYRNNTGSVIRIVDLVKTYPMVDGSAAVLAVKSLNLAVEARECFGILGPNGAGKTTALNCLCGMFEPTSGTAFINGFNIKTDMARIHQTLGICSQHDILWDHMTGREHLLFYGRLKGRLNSVKKALDEEVEKVLKEVNLFDVQDRHVSQYSGGMKRRLSVAIALIGKPPVIIMDEPSTGLDPASRRNLWDVISRYKKDSAIILTTHSMEEADALCDRIGIMANGELKCVGTSAELKFRFGRGYRLTVNGSMDHDKQIHEFVNNIVDAKLLNSMAGTHNYDVKKSSVELSILFDQMETNKDRLGITDWGVSNTTLEEVFLAITRGAEE